MTLALSIAALLLGPVICAALQKNPIAKRIFNAAILIAIAFIIVVHIIPEALRHGGKLAAVFLLLGLAFPVVLERLFRKAADTAHMVIVVLATTGLLIHAIIDGVALLPESGGLLAYAIVLHRLPVGMAIWWVVRPNFGAIITATLFTLIILATTAGYYVGDSFMALAETRSLALLQAFISGSLVHVATFGVKHDHH
jgi:hypothetical protein